MKLHLNFGPSSTALRSLLLYRDNAFARSALKARNLLDNALVKLTRPSEGRKNLATASQCALCSGNTRSSLRRNISDRRNNARLIDGHTARGANAPGPPRRRRVQRNTNKFANPIEDLRTFNYVDPPRRSAGRAEKLVVQHAPLR
ncbi:hypothetical protein EVAR_38711_1 [Eumeta japonica]|uniref:Uncharacterized protein n=1 Tax=Eumeta variegata TaxID=151549 RepID=A0A4C1XNS6_EUMVA|nr:hypothetical protein EVAR_38711_1 [Eumeta japonica]